MMRKITYWLAVVLIFIVPWEDSITVEILGSLVTLVGLFVAAFWTATILMEGRFRKPNLFHAFVLIFFLWSFVSVAWSIDTDGTFQRIKTYSQLFLLLIIFWDIFQKPEQVRAGLQAYVYGAYIPIISTIYNYIQGTVASPYEGRYSATGVNAVDLALILIMGLPIAMQLFFTAEQNKKGILLKLINLLYIPLAIFTITLTGSRTSLLAVIPFGFYLVLTHQIKFGRKILIFGILIILLVALFPYIPQSVITRLGTFGSSIETGDLSGRVDLWKESIVIFSQHPIIGLGAGTMVTAIGKPVHNTFLSVAAETGSIGFILFFIILASVFVQALNIRKGNSGLWVAVFLIWVIGVCSLSWEFRKPTWLFLNFIVIEGSFAYEKLQVEHAKVEISKNIKRSLNANNPEIKEAG
jgi:O-antigen ligase